MNPIRSTGSEPRQGQGQGPEREQEREQEQPTLQRSIPELVAEVYEAAPLVERGRLVSHLLRPLGVLSLVVIADGIFAKARFRAGWQSLNVHLEDIQNVHGADIVALVDHAQQISVETVDGLAQLVAASPLLAGSTAAALLLTALIQRARFRDAAAGQSRPAAPGPG